MTHTHYIVYGYKFGKEDLASNYKDLPFEAYEYQVIPELEKYLFNANKVKMASLAFLRREDDRSLYIGYVITRFPSGYLFKNPGEVANMFRINLLEQKALMKGWGEFKLVRKDLSDKLGFYFV